jgi:signal transduction histidine kinase
MKTAENTTFYKSGGLKSLYLSGTMAGTGKTSENKLMLRLKEMEEVNSCLEKLIEQRTKRLREVVATNTKFLSIIAHDLRSPFNSILNTLGLIKASFNNFNKKEIENYIDIALNSANNTLNLLDKLLAWTISQNNGKSFIPIRINLQELLKDEIDNLNASANQKQIMLNQSIPPNLNIAADIQMVRTVLRNLISNAIKYTSTGGEINVSASELKQYVEIVVKDNGIGISFEDQRNLFKIDAFHSTEGTNNEKGAGLGLLLCKEFVEMHGGDIRVESIQGKGSKFIFTMPHYI